MRFTKRLSVGLVAGLAVLTQFAPASAQTGGFKGTFVLKGEAPKLAPIKGDKDPQVCAVAPIPNEILIVDPATKGVKNVFVWVAKIDEKKVSKEALAPKTPTLTLDNEQCRFVPHCAIAHSGQTLVMLNADAVGHNVHTNPLKPPAINDLVAPNDREGIKKPVGKAQILPIPVNCDIHPWMKGHLLILDHNFAALSDEKGAFTIEGLPPGKYDFKVWQEAGGYVVGAKGIENVEIKADAVTDGGKIEIDVAKLKNLKS